MRLTTDLAIVGSGFAGSILALVARRLGLSVVLLERGAHPRIVLGESTTPLSNLVLADLARHHRLPTLLSLASYGRWRRARPDLPVGKKRGFTFLAHRPGRHVEDGPAHRLLVEASDRDEVADVQWRRADLDHLLVREAVAAGATYVDRAEIGLDALEREPRITVRRGGDTWRVEARLLVDASGPGGFLNRELAIPAREGPLRTWTLFSHFTGVARLSPLLSRLGHDTGAHPYTCDDAAVHHVFDGGWMWHLRFEDGVVSAGFVFDAGAVKPDPSLSPSGEWALHVARFPTLAEAFREAAPLFPIQRIASLARLGARAAGPTWALLPHAAYFADPLLSGGIPHSLLAIERLAALLERGLDRADLSDALARYESDLLAEASALGSLVATCYGTFPCFEVFASWVMTYFVAASSLEAGRRAGRAQERAAGLLRFLEPEFRAALRALERDLADAPRNPAVFASRVADRLRPWNREGFCDPAANGLYRSPPRPEIPDMG